MESWLLCFRDQLPADAPEKTANDYPSTGPVPPTWEDLNGDLGSWLWLCPAPFIAAVWVVNQANQQMEDLPSTPSCVTLPLKLILKKISKVESTASLLEFLGSSLVSTLNPANADHRRQRVRA